MTPWQSIKSFWLFVFAFFAACGYIVGLPLLFIVALDPRSKIWHIPHCPDILKVIMVVVFFVSWLSGLVVMVTGDSGYIDLS